MILQKMLEALRSKLLALVLMLLILVVITIATVFLPDQIAHHRVFSSLWFNGLLVLLVLNTACCFFSRIHRRGWTLVSTGMIIFHLSFVAMFVGIIIDSLFHFKGSLRLTEGESISMASPIGYDRVIVGRFFKQSWLRGDVNFLKMHTDYKVGNEKKGPACEISVVEGARLVSTVIYPTHHLEFNGFKFFKDKEGYAPLFMLSARNGKELYGGYVSLQSFKRKDGTYIYTTGTKQYGPGSADFPQIQNVPQLFKIQFTYHPPKSEKGVAEASFRVWKHDKGKNGGQGGLVFEGAAPLGEKVVFGDYGLSMKEVRYWASMDVLYSPGQPIVFVSFWAALAGLSLTLYGRMRQRSSH